MVMGEKEAVPVGTEPRGEALMGLEGVGRVAIGERLPPPPPEALPVPLALPPGALPLAQLVLRGEGVLLGEGCELR